jgi:hypothetical protein
MPLLLLQPLLTRTLMPETLGAQPLRAKALDDSTDFVRLFHIYISMAFRRITILLDFKGPPIFVVTVVRRHRTAVLCRDSSCTCKLQLWTLLLGSNAALFKRPKGDSWLLGAFGHCPGRNRLGAHPKTGVQAGKVSFSHSQRRRVK